MKRLIVFFLISLLAFSIFAEDSADEKTTVEVAVSTTKFEPTKKGDTINSTFKITFEGSTQGVLYTDIGFATAPTTLTTGSGLSKKVIDNNAVTMAHMSSSSTMNYDSSDTYYDYYEYESTVYVYWYCSFNMAKNLKMTVTPGKGCAVGFTYVPYTYTTKENTTETTTGSGKNKQTITTTTYDISGATGEAVTASSSSSEQAVTVASFPSAIAVYHGNSKVDFTARVSGYPDNGVIATVKLTLESS